MNWQELLPIIFELIFFLRFGDDIEIEYEIHDE